MNNNFLFFLQRILMIIPPFVQNSQSTQFCLSVTQSTELCISMHEEVIL